MEPAQKISQLSETERLLATAPIGKLMFKFAIPSVISMVVNSLYNIVDQIFIGQGVGYLGNAATNIIFPITLLALAASMLMGEGAAIYFSLQMGLGRRDKAERGISNALFVVSVTGTLFLIFGLAFLHQLIYIFGARGEVIPYALDYGRIIILGLPFTIISGALGSWIRADGNPQLSMAIMLAGCILNFILDPLFIFVFNWGVKGAALATIIGQIVGFVMAVCYINRFKNIKIRRENLKPSFKLTLTLSKYGMSSVINQLAVMAVVSVLNNLYVKYGAQSIYGAEIPLAAHGICMKVNSILFFICIGIAVGCQPIIGYNFGAGNFDRVKKAYIREIILAMSTMLVGFLIFQFKPEIVINLFGQENELYNDFAKKCFRIFLSLMVLNGFQIVTGIFFQAIGKPNQAMFISVSRQIIFFIPSAFILAHLKGVLGILYAGPVADFAAFVLAFVLVIHEFKHNFNRENVKDMEKTDKAALA